MFVGIINFKIRCQKYFISMYLVSQTRMKHSCKNSQDVSKSRNPILEYVKTRSITFKLIKRSSTANNFRSPTVKSFINIYCSLSILGLIF